MKLATIKQSSQRVFCLFVARVDETRVYERDYDRAR